MLVKSLSILYFIFCLSVKAEEEIEDFSNDEHYQLATVFSCSCDTNGDGFISTLEIHQGKFCKVLVLDF